MNNSILRHSKGVECLNLESIRTPFSGSSAVFKIYKTIVSRKIIFCVHIDRIYRNYLIHCDLENKDKVKKTISKMAEARENGVRMVVFLTKFDFNIQCCSFTFVKI